MTGPFKMTDDQNAKQCHLGFIQNVITRMAGNSFLLRGWSVTLIVAIFSLAAKDADARVGLLSYYSAVLFWTLDTYYIRQEKLFRTLYSEIAQGNIPTHHYSLDTRPISHLVMSFQKTFFSRTILSFHAPVLILISLGIAVVSHGKLSN